MKRSLTIAAMATLLTLSGAANAQTLGDRLEQGLRKVGEGAAKVGEGAGKIVDSVGDSIDSTAELMSNDEDPQDTRNRLDAMAAETLDRLFTEQPEAKGLYDIGAGYAVFDTRKVTLIGFTGGGGRGVAVSDAGARTYMNMGTAGVGAAFGIGGFESQVVMIFQDPQSFQNFVTVGFDATAEAGTVFGDDKDSLEFRFEDGRAIFVLTNRGWRVSATAAGTKYWVDANLN